MPDRKPINPASRAEVPFGDTEVLIGRLVFATIRRLPDDPTSILCPISVWNEATHQVDTRMISGVTLEEILAKIRFYLPRGVVLTVLPPYAADVPGDDR